MAIDITIPRLGWNMDEGVFVAWLKHDGELVKAGEPIFSLETDKAVQEIESLDSGRLRIAPGGPSPGQTVAVGTVIGVLLGLDEAAQDTGTEATAPAPPAAVATAAPRSSPRARRKARELGIDWTSLRERAAPAGSGNATCLRPRPAPVRPPVLRPPISSSTASTR